MRGHCMQLTSIRRCAVIFSVAVLWLAVAAGAAVSQETTPLAVQVTLSSGNPAEHRETVAKWGRRLFRALKNDLKAMADVSVEQVQPGDLNTDGSLSEEFLQAYAPSYLINCELDVPVFNDMWVVEYAITDLSDDACLCTGSSQLGVDTRHADVTVSAADIRADLLRTATGIAAVEGVRRVYPWCFVVSTYRHDDPLKNLKLDIPGNICGHLRDALGELDYSVQGTPTGILSELCELDYSSKVEDEHDTYYFIEGVVSSSDVSDEFTISVSVTVYRPSSRVERQEFLKVFSHSRSDKDRATSELAKHIISEWKSIFGD